ncbi:MAG TPA: hypothetical protein VMU51_15755 [Mycobacteriales bacterium]|nr:hypothetical protein [Mycobacteriales bacterium]
MADATDEVVGAAMDGTAALLAVLLGWLDRFSEWEPNRRPKLVRLLTFADVVGYFAASHPGDPVITGGALLRQAHPGGALVFQVFLDRADGLCVDRDGRPYGRVIVAERLDSELAEKFADVDLIVFR